MMMMCMHQVAAPQNKYGAAKKLVDFLKKGVHYEVDEKAQNVLLTDQGVRDCEKVRRQTTRRQAGRADEGTIPQAGRQAGKDSERGGGGQWQ